MTSYGKRGKPKAGFPSFPTALGNRCAIPTFPRPRLFPLLPNQNQRKEAPLRIASLPRSGSFFNEKMLSRPHE